MFERIRNLLSRKFLVTVLTPLFLALMVKFNSVLALPMDSDLMGQCVKWLVSLAIAYVIGESIRDSVAAKNGTH